MTEFADAESYRVEAMTPGCQFVYGGTLHTIQRVQPGRTTTYLVTDEAEDAVEMVGLDGETRTHQPYRTFVFDTGTWIKGYA